MHTSHAEDQLLEIATTQRPTCSLLEIIAMISEAIFWYSSNSLVQLAVLCFRTPPGLPNFGH